MDKIVNDLYDEVKLGDLKPLMVMQVNLNVMAKKVLLEIAKNDPSIVKVDSGVLEGVTKEVIRKSIYTTTMRGAKKDGEGRTVNPSIKVIDDAVSFLEGATLVYYQLALREKRWLLTGRGAEVIIQMMHNGDIKEEDLYENK